MVTMLLEPLLIGDLEIPNRIIMAPLTRGRASEGAVPNDLMAEYYAQRATAGLIITEATAISQQGFGWYGAPGIFTDAHVEGWKKVTGAVHDKDGRIFLQLWHMGRVSHPDFQNGEKPVGPSAIAAKGESRTPNGKKPYVEPHALSRDEIKQIVEDYVVAAKRAMQAGFDGVEIHAANGYLIDQFIRDGSNKREDAYGGSIDNRLRFCREVVDAVITEVPAGRTGIRISPQNPFNDMTDSNPKEVFSELAEQLNDRELGYLHIMEPFSKDHPFAHGEYCTPAISISFESNVILNGGYDAESAESALGRGFGNAVAFGVPYIANPDLVERIKTGAAMNDPKPEFFYDGGAKGYTDYPFLEGSAKAAAS